MQESEKVEAIEDKALEPTEIVELDEEVSSTEEAPIEDISKEEAVKDKEEDELVDYSKSVKKRISTLTKKMREQERAAQSAFEYAKNLQAENETLKKNSSELNKNYQSEAENRLKSQRAQANAVLKSAYQDQDWDKVTKAQDILGKINLEEGKLATSKMTVQPTENYQNYQEPKAQTQAQAPKPDPKAEDWANKNDWFGEDETMTLAAFNIHRKLIEEEGFDTTDPMYYTQIDKRMRYEFPHKFSDGGEAQSKGRIQQTVAPAGRSESSGRKRQVKLTKSEVEMARRLNVPLKEYAKHIKR
jgi:regulator of replication initiation timing|tara:strand:- start:552 stop:1454 length:903 start_codon:yes stop_codon:yes gene_type:complete